MGEVSPISDWQLAAGREASACSAFGGIVTGSRRRLIDDEGNPPTTLQSYRLVP